MVVDSPGIGETRHMEELVMNYISKAAAFIFILDSTNAGGMQERVTVTSLYMTRSKCEKKNTRGCTK